MTESLQNHPNFSYSNSITMNMLPQGTSDIQKETPSLISSTTSTTVSLIIQNPQSFNYILGFTYSSDVNYLTNDQSFTIIEGSSVKLNPELPCSLSGSTSIVYNILNYLGEILPSWVSINSSTGELSIIAPDVDKNTEFYFYINSGISGSRNLVQKLIKLTIQNWTVENWIVWSSSSTTVWFQWKSGYNLESDSCVLPKITTSSVIESKNSPSNLSESMKLTSQWVLASTMSVIAIVSILNSSLSSLWSMINQIQLFYLLLLTGVYIPIDVKTVITGMKVAINMPQLISFQKVDLYNSFLDLYNFGLSSTDYDILNIESKSTLYNFIPSLTLAVFIVISHLMVIFIHKLFMKYCQGDKISWFLVIVKWIVDKTFIILTFGWYIRYILEMNQYLLVSSVFEIYNFDKSQSLKIASLVFAILAARFCLLLISIVSYLALSGYEVYSDAHNKIGEFFSGIKMQKK